MRVSIIYRRRPRVRPDRERADRRRQVDDGDQKAFSMYQFYDPRTTVRYQTFELK